MGALARLLSGDRDAAVLRAERRRRGVRSRRPRLSRCGDDEYRQIALAFIDPNLGGSGYLPRIAAKFNAVASAARDHLDHPNSQTACYRCLKKYDNQRHHEKLDSPRVFEDLSALGALPVTERPLATGNIDDPQPWLEAYAAGVGSPQS